MSLLKITSEERADIARRDPEGFRSACIAQKEARERRDYPPLLFWIFIGVVVVASLADIFFGG